MADRSEGFRRRLEETRAMQDRLRGLVADKRSSEAEPSAERNARFEGRRAKRILPAGRAGAEAVQGNTIDFQGAWFLADGAQARRAVGYVEVTTPGRSTIGTGFLISPSLFLTNQHVVRDADAARGAVVTFDREIGDNGRLADTTTFQLDPDRLAVFSDETDLDYALVAVSERRSGRGAITDFGFCPLSTRDDKHRLGMNTNIIQHPNGLPKMISVRNNVLVARTDFTLLYDTDTETGSSGSPVFNDDWDVIALHHYGEPFRVRSGADGKPIDVHVNEGIRISAISADLQKRSAGLSGEGRRLLTEALSLDAARPPVAGKLLSPPRPVGEAVEMPVVPAHPKTLPVGAAAMASASSSPNSVTLVVPVEITVRIGAAGGAATAAPVAPSPGGEPPKQLTRRAEKLVVDTDYSNRTGYDPRFIGDVVLPLPKVGPRRAPVIAALRAGEPEAATGELKYEHFSVVLDRSKRMAAFSATNIDGATYLAVDRDTGKVKPGAEAESWFLDPRVSASFYLDQSFYSAWSTFFDRGHLTRRTDPTWGTAEMAERANADTFHFPNCSPQHFRFNQTAGFWQGAERFVLENGVLDTDARKPITVFQGPIFNDSIDRFADDAQIPSSFFKVIVWKGRHGLSAVGLVVDQLPLLDEQRRALGAPQALPSVDVAQWRVAIRDIERRTDLDFGDAVRGADTIGDPDQPHVGEAIVPLRSFADILAPRGGR